MGVVLLNEWPRWMTKEQAGLYTCFSKKQIERFINQGLLKETRINGGHSRIDRKELDQLMESNKIDIRRTARKILKEI